MFESKTPERLEAAVMGAEALSPRSKQAATASASVPESARICPRGVRTLRSTPPSRRTP